MIDVRVSRALFLLTCLPLRRVISTLSLCLSGRVNDLTIKNVRVTQGRFTQVSNNTLRVTRILERLIKVLRTITIFRLLRPTSANLRVLRHVKNSNVGRLYTRINVRIILAFNLRCHLILCHALDRLLLRLRSFLIVLVDTRRFRVLTLTTLRVMSFGLEEISVRVSRTLISSRSTSFTMVTSILVRRQVTRTRSRSILIMMEPYRAILVLNRSFVEQENFRSELIINRQVLKVITINVRRCVGSFESVVLMKDGNTCPTILNRENSCPRLLTLIRRRVLLRITIVVVENVFTQRRSYLVNLLLLCLSVLRVNDGNTNGLTLNVVLLIRSRRASFTLRFTTRVMNTRLLNYHEVDEVGHRTVVINRDLI